MKHFAQVRMPGPYFIQSANRIKLRWLPCGPSSKSNKGRVQGTAARGPFDVLMERVAPPEGIAYELDKVGGVQDGGAVLKEHGRTRHDARLWRMVQLGSAQAFRHLAGHMAAASGALVFVPDNRLAPGVIRPPLALHGQRE